MSAAWVEKRADVEVLKVYWQLQGGSLETAHFLRPDAVVVSMPEANDEL